MSHAGYVAVAWVTTVGSVGLYAARTIWRGRQLSKVVPSEARRWS